MSPNTRVLASLAAGVFGAIGIVAVAAAFDGGDRAGGPDTPVDGRPGDGPAVTANPLHAARLDLADRLDIDPGEVHLVSLRYTGWNGCLGVIPDNGICTELFAAGTIAIFDVDARLYRYHVAGDRIIATDFVKGRIDDGIPLPDDMKPDTAAMLGGYLRGDLSLALDVPIDEISVVSFAEVRWPDGCIGVYYRDAFCTLSLVDGWLAILKVDGDTREYRYHGADHGGYIAVWALDPADVRIGEPLPR